MRNMLAMSLNLSATSSRISVLLLEILASDLDSECLCLYQKRSLDYYQRAACNRSSTNTTRAKVDMMQEVNVAFSQRTKMGIDVLTSRNSNNERFKLPYSANASQSY